MAMIIWNLKSFSEVLKYLTCHTLDICIARVRLFQSYLCKSPTGTYLEKMVTFLLLLSSLMVLIPMYVSRITHMICLFLAWRSEETWICTLIISGHHWWFYHWINHTSIQQQCCQNFSCQTATHLLFYPSKWLQSSLIFIQ